MEKRDVFECQADADGGPFFEFVRNLSKGLPAGAVSSIDSKYSGSTIGEYQIADNTLRDIARIDGEDGEGEKDEELLDHLRSGMINLFECLRVRRERDEEQYRQWLDSEMSRVEVERRRRVQERKIKLGFADERESIVEPESAE